MKTMLKAALPIAILLLGFGTICIENIHANPRDSASDKATDSGSGCTYNGIPLKGKVKVVTSFGDIKVQVVDAFADIHVQVVTAFPDDCGKWQFVDAFPDFTIQYVTAFPDIKVKFVDAFPGMQ